MIVPTKYLDLDSSLIRIAAIVLMALQRNAVMPFDELEQIIRKEAGDVARFNFIPALTFLYLVGKLDYNPEPDAVISLIQPMESMR